MAPLAALRTQQGYHAAVVDIEDVYDEFSFGEKTPQALRDFLQWAHGGHWQRARGFVVRAGDATAGPRDYSELGSADFVPTKDVAMTQLAVETGSDEWFVGFDENGLPGVAIGRLSVRTAAQAEAVVGKLVADDQNAALPWTKNVLLVADTNDATSNFEQPTTNLTTVIPSEYTKNQLFRGSVGDDVAHQTLIDRVNNGQLIVNYFGHGSVHIWSDGNPPLLQNASEGQPIDDVRTSWQNLARLPFVVAITFLNRLFHPAFDHTYLPAPL